MRKLILIPLLFTILYSCTSIDEKKTLAEVKVTNPTDFNRTIETVALAWNTFAKEGLVADSLIVIEKSSGLEIPSQLIKDDNGRTTTLLFQTQNKQQSTRTFIIKEGTPQPYKTKTYGAIINKRYDDFAWENDIIAYRVYNKKLIPIDGPSGGIDVWTKRTNKLIVDKWYKNGHYHTDHGEGCDFYKVGPSLGAGGLGFVHQGKLIQHANYNEAKIIAEGPIRFQAELTFPKVKLGNKEISFSKIITLDAGQNLNQYTVNFSSLPVDVTVATGIVLRPEGNKSAQCKSNTHITYWQPKDKKHDYIGIGVINLKGSKIGQLDHHLIIESTLSEKTFNYYSGACWSKAENKEEHLHAPNNKEDWEHYVSTYKKQLQTPLVIKVSKK